MEEDKKYAVFEHSFMDAWTGAEVNVAFRFARPSATQIKMLQKQGAKDASLASRNLLMGTIHPDDKDSFLQSIEEHPGLVITFSSGIIKSIGTADLGN